MKNERRDQPTLFGTEQSAARDSGPVTCLGLTFPNDEERRRHFLGILREGLEELHTKLDGVPFTTVEDVVARMKSVEKWPMGDEAHLQELAESMRLVDSSKDILQRWKDEVGFPHGSIEDILALSDPPYYTACPNPFITDFIKHYGKPYDPITDDYRREPFASDTGAGKTHPIYTAHSYHSKIPHLATMPCILHYTDPGDIVLDGFSGSGMTGVAAQLCGQPEAEFKATLETEWKKAGYEPPKWGVRRPILIDLSPVANFIAYNLNVDVSAREFKKAADAFFKKIEAELDWMYETFHVEPASSRLLSALEEFTPCDPFQATKGIFRKDNLPHIQVPGATYFITFRTHDFRELSPYARTLALNAVRHWDNQRWKLFSAVVMPDHVHIIAKPLPKQGDQYWDLSEILHSIKSFSANKINELEEKTGSSVWQTESYDRIIRDVHELLTEITYIHYNPVKARLAKKGEEYAWRYMADEFSIAGWKPAPLGKINYVVWSEVFTCPNCAGDVVFMDQAYDPQTGKFAGEFECPGCRAALTTRSCEHKFTSYFDKAIGETVRKVTYVPVEIEYTLPGDRTKRRKEPDEHDLSLLKKLTESIPDDRFPTQVIPEEIYHYSRLAPKGVTHFHQLYIPRALHALSVMWRIAGEWPDARVRGFLKFMVEQCFWGLTMMNRYGGDFYSQVNRFLGGVFYLPTLISETSPWLILDGKYKRLQKMLVTNQLPTSRQVIISTASSLRSPIPDKSIDYIYTDLPFGDFVPYGDLNLLIESWHEVFSNLSQEVLVDTKRRKSVSIYGDMLRRGFAEYYRTLKPGRWITIVFHNSKNSIWNVLQEAIGAAGFVVADVRMMERGSGSYRQVTASTAVKADVIISAYKPNSGLEERFKMKAGTEEGVWDFVRTHLKQLPVFVSKDGQAEIIAERQNYLLFDRMVAFHVQRGVTVPLSAAEFYVGLAQRFPERDGMYFLPEQVAEYDKKRMTVREVLQLQLFVVDESSAIQWLKQQLTKKPQTFQELHPQFLKEIGGWQKHEKPLELSELLEQNFLRYDGKDEVPNQIHSYLSTNFKELRNLPKDDESLRAKGKDRWYVPDPNKAGDLEKLRERSLLKEFEDYRTSNQRKLKVFRLEAVRAGFKKAWQERDYATIITVARKIPENVLHEDPKLLMWYDQAVTRSGEDA